MLKEPPVATHATALADLIDQGLLLPHFQPIVQLSDGSVHGHEALIRTPPGCRWANPDELFGAARESGLSTRLEIECVRAALQAWSRFNMPGRLYLNLSAAALMAALAEPDVATLLTRLGNGMVAPESIVVELTEHEQVRDVEALALAVARLRRHKVALALDDFGDGRSSLRLWSELKPEIVKIDKYFSRHLSRHAEKLQTLRALLQISQTLGASLVAEGIESTEDLHLVRDLGIRLGQGWALGWPQALPVAQIAAPALAVIRSKDVAVFPERRRTTQQRASARTLPREVVPVPPHCSRSRSRGRGCRHQWPLVSATWPCCWRWSARARSSRVPSSTAVSLSTRCWKPAPRSVRPWAAMPGRRRQASRRRRVPCRIC